MTWQWLGPTGNVADKYYRNMQYMAEAFDMTINHNDNVTIEDIQAMPAIIFEAVSDIPTVSRNMKNYYAHVFVNNPAFMKDGKYMWDFETMNTQTAIFGAMGFQPNEVTDMYELNKHIMDSGVEFSTFGETDSDVIIRIINTRLLTGKKIQDTAMYARIVRGMLSKYGPREQLKLMTLIRDKTLGRKFDQNNLMYKALIKSEEKQQEGLNILNSLFARKLQERQ